MTSNEVRKRFLDYFRSKGHEIVPSAPMVVKDDPTLMFTNAGMNQFKDIFLGNRKPEYLRVANAQKCLRVSGKHNDLEEVGHDTYHHTMFEMLGNWSFGDYFKEEAIDMAWEFLTREMGIDPSRLYATVFEGDPAAGLGRDDESAACWAARMPAGHILDGSKKDNFWEMGDIGPCGPCTEIHIDLRDDEARRTTDGRTLVNRGHPLVIEIWNLVFIQYNRRDDGTLVPLPQRHVDTGMGFERLCMVMQGKRSNYDTDLFMPLIHEIGAITGMEYGRDEKADVAMRVVADHLRAVAFAIADGQLPSNNKAGYVIRRILRRAVRYGYTYLHREEPFIYRLVPVLIQVMGDAYPELRQQEEVITRVIREEEKTFLRTLNTGIALLERMITENKQKGSKIIGGKEAFELYDTFGFPLDLTALIARESGMEVDTAGFEEEMRRQKERSRRAAAQQAADWTVVHPGADVRFIGYDALESPVHILKYRPVQEKKKTLWHLVLDRTPFYAEAGGQVGDTGHLIAGDEKIRILDTKKENDLIIHVADRLPRDPAAEFRAVVDRVRRDDTARNHSATHLLHWALRQVLGDHVEQKGSLVHPDYLRFDFSHFSKVEQEDLDRVEALVNDMIRRNLPLEERRDVPLDEARGMGAMMLFGEKYGDKVRVIRFGESVELCGGTHVPATGSIGFFKITAETAVAAGIRRIEAVTGRKAEAWVRERVRPLDTLITFFKARSAGEVVERVETLLETNNRLQRSLDDCNRQKAGQVKEQLLQKAETVNGIRLLGGVLDLSDAKTMKDLAFQLRNEEGDMAFVGGMIAKEKPQITVMLADSLVQKGLDAREIIRAVAPIIRGGGGGQPFYATAGGKETGRLEEAVLKAMEMIREKIR